MIDTIENIDHLNEILAEHDSVIIDFTLKSCGHCARFAPIFEDYANCHNGDLEFIKIDISDSRDIAKEYNVNAVPALFFVKEGEIIDSKLGALSQECLDSWIESMTS